MGLYRRSHAPLSIRRRASCWTSVAVVVLLSMVFSLVCVRDYLHDFFGGQPQNAEVAARRLGDDTGYWDDVIIDQPYGSSDKRYLVFIHIIVIGYMLLGLNTVCDLYFTGALDEMVNQWNVKPDVAGATFMAAGGSAPELFTSLIGAVVSESDVGFSTIVGSAVFNVLFVIGLCGFTAIEPIKLTWWPLARDCTYYIFGLSVLAIFAKTGGTIEWWEAVILFCMYIGYCIMMYFNPVLERIAYGRPKVEVEVPSPPAKVAPALPLADTGSTSSPSDVQKEPEDHGSRSEGAGSDGGQKHHIKKSQPHFERKSQCVVPIKDRNTSKVVPCPGEAPEDQGQSEGTSDSGTLGRVPTKESGRSGDSSFFGDDDEEDDIEALLLMPDGNIPRFLWCLSMPIYLSLYYGIPKPSEKMFAITFLVSLVWIGTFSFLLVYCVEILGAVLNIHIIIMGFTVLAAGTSIPDLVASMAVAAAGEGDMAISSSIGSNIFDILVGLPIPWVIKIVFVETAFKGTENASVVIKSPYIVMYVIILIVMILSVVLSIHMLKWELNRTLGIGMAFLYAVFLLIVLLVEFGDPDVGPLR